ncbi:MAG: hypothetical protein IT377_30325 [Polyangiaceae bacterium]|nr:hypothetical protein [Polyangiaceae bacterium]
MTGSRTTPRRAAVAAVCATVAWLAVTPAQADEGEDAWFRRASRDEQQRKAEERRHSADLDAREAEERRRWFLGLSAGGGVASGSRDFRADYLHLGLVVSRHAHELSSPDNFSLAMEVPVRRYVARTTEETAWGTGLFVHGGGQVSWLVASLGAGVGLMPSASGGVTSVGARARVGVRAWRFVVAGEVGGSCGDSATGGLVCLGEAGGVLSLDLVRAFGGGARRAR